MELLACINNRAYECWTQEGSISRELSHANYSIIIEMTEKLLIRLI